MCSLVLLGACSTFLIFSPFYSQDFGSSLLSLAWIIFQVHCLLPLHLFGLLGFYLAPSSAVCFCLLILLKLLCLGSPFHRLQVRSSCCFWRLPPVAKVHSVGCVGFLVEGLVLVFWCMRLDLVFLVGRSTSSVVFCGVCYLIMILGSLSANGCGYVPVFLVVCHGCPAL